MANKILTQSGKVGARRLDEYHAAIEEQILRKDEAKGCMNSWREYIPPQAYADQLKRCEEFRAVPSLAPQIQGVSRD